MKRRLLSLFEHLQGCLSDGKTYDDYVDAMVTAREPESLLRYQPAVKKALLRIAP